MKNSRWIDRIKAILSFAESCSGDSNAAFSERVERMLSAYLPEA